MKWEYQCIQLIDMPANVTRFNLYGSEGWELVTLYGDWAIFKRPIVEAETSTQVAVAQQITGQPELRTRSDLIADLRDVMYTKRSGAVEVAVMLVDKGWVNFNTVKPAVAEPKREFDLNELRECIIQSFEAREEIVESQELINQIARDLVRHGWVSTE
jgi:hypothetical protein